MIAKLSEIGVRRVQLALDPLRDDPAVWGKTPQLFQQAGITIVSGLNIGDLVVTAGANLLLPGQKVRLLEVPGVAKATGQGAGKP